MFLCAKYGVQTTFSFPMIKRGVVDLAVTGDWTPATGDTKVSKDFGTVANTSNNPAIVAGTGSVSWSLVLTATELTAAVVDVQIVDSATKAVEDQYLTVYTYGHASAKIVEDWSVAKPTNANLLSIDANGRVDAIKVAGTTQTARDLGASVLLSPGTGTGQLDITSGVVKSNLVQILATALTETAGLLAGGFKKLFNVASPTGTLNSIPDAVPDAVGGLPVTGNRLTAIPTVAAVTAVTTVNGLAAGVITAASIAADAITAAKIADGAIDAATFAAGAINAAAIAADAITDAKVASDVTIASVTGAVGSVTGLTPATVHSNLTDVLARLAPIAKKLSAVNDASASATVFITDLTETANDYWKDAYVRITSGALIDQVKKISGYNGTTKAITVVGGFTAAPADNVTFVLIND